MTRATRTGSRLQYVFPRINFTLSSLQMHWHLRILSAPCLIQIVGPQVCDAITHWTKAHYKKHVLNHVLIKLQVSHYKAHHSNR